MAFYIYLLTFLLTSFVVQAKELPGCYLIKSTYKDEMTQQPSPIPTQGTACVFESIDKNKKYILTDAHVTGGENIQIVRSSNQIIYLEIIGRLIKGHQDLDLIEINSDSGLIPMGYWDPEIKNVVAYKDILSQWIPLYGKNKIQDSTYIEMSTYSSQIDFTFPQPSPFALIGPWIKEKPDYIEPEKIKTFGLIFESELQRHKADYSYLPYSNELWSSVRIVPGMSGSPIFKFVRDSQNTPQYVLQGLVKQYIIGKMSGTVMSSPSQIKNIFENYENNKRGYVDSVQWLYRNGLTYRKYSQNTFEINPANRSAGGGGTNDGGGGGTNDGGFTLDSDPISFYEKFQIEPGLLVEGKSIIAIRSPIGAIYANYQALDYFKELNNLNSIIKNAIFSESSLYDFFVEKFNLTHENYSSHKIKPIESEPFVVSTLGANLQVIIKNKNFHFTLFGENNERIDFELNKYGILMNSKYKKFEPIIFVKSNNCKNIYAIDLRSFFFIQLNEMMINHEYAKSDINQKYPELKITKVYPPTLIFKKYSKTRNKKSTTFISIFNQKGYVDSYNLSPQLGCVK